MDSTYSPTLSESAKVWGSQTTLTSQEPLQSVGTDVGNIRYLDNYIQLPGSGWTISSTGFGNLGLKPDSSSSVVLIIYLQEDQINKVLPYSSLNEATLNKWRDHSLSLMDLLHLSPHLEAIRWTETAPALSNEWLCRIQPSVLAKRPLTEQEFMELQYHEGKLSNFPHPEPLTQEEQAERERLGMLFASDKPLSELVIEDRGPY